MGKTAFALNIAKQAADLQEVTTAFISLHRSKEQIGECINNSRWGSMLDLIIDDAPISSVEEVIEKCRIYKKENGVGLIIIDYLQLICNKQWAEMDLELDKDSIAIMSENIKTFSTRTSCSYNSNFPISEISGGKRK